MLESFISSFEVRRETETLRRERESVEDHLKWFRAGLRKVPILSTHIPLGRT